MQSIKIIAFHILQALSLSQASITASLLGRYLNPSQAYKLFSKHNYHLLKDHYYLPIPNSHDLDFLDSNQSSLKGLKFKDSQYWKFVEEKLSPYITEFDEIFPLDKLRSDGGFYLLNGCYMATDAHMYYALIRYLKPKTIIEIGSGFSTLVAGKACLQNKKDRKVETNLIAIEPYPSFKKSDIPGLTKLIKKPVQEVPLSMFSSLKKHDILFIDSTHVLRPGGDVQYEFLEILPCLPSEVYVHIHDISLPKPYPREYCEKQHWYWNEQYLLQAFLAFNSKFSIVWPGNYLMQKNAKKMLSLFPSIKDMRLKYPNSEPSSFWIKS